MNASQIRQKFTIPDAHWFWVVFAVLMGLLGSQAALHPTLEGDALEIVAAVETYGVIHAPGFPVYMILLHLFSGLLFFVKTSHAVSLFSVFCAAMSSSVLFWLARSLGVQRGVAIVFSILPVFALEVWYQSLIAEVYSLAVLWMLLICQSFILLHKKNTGTRVGWMMFLLVSGFATHLYVWPMIPAGMLFLLWKWKREHWKISGMALILGGLLGLLPLLQLPLMAGRSRYVNEGNVNSWERFFDHVTWKLHRERLVGYEEKRKENFGKWFDVKFQQLKYFAGDIATQYSVPLLGVLLLLMILVFFPPPISLLKRGPPTVFHHTLFLFSLALFLNIWLVFAGSDFQPSVLAEMKVHFVPVYYFFCLWLALGLQLYSHQTFRQGVTALVGALVLGHIVWNYKILNIRNNDMAIVHGREVLQNLPQGAILFSQGDVDLMAIMYQQAVEDFRTDIHMVNLVNGTWWYFENLQHSGGGLELPTFYSKYFQLEIIERNFGKVPIYFSNYYAALLVLQQPTMKDRFLVVPEKGGYRLTVEKQMLKDSVDLSLANFTNFSQSKERAFLLRGVEKDLAGQYMDYYSRRAELLSVFQKKTQAEKEYQMGYQQPVFDSHFNRLIREQLLKTGKRFGIGDQ